MDQPLVSVITVTYNSALYVKDAIESVLGQTYTNIEYIIADDCSQDNTWSIIREYGDPRIKAYKNDGNLGEYPNRNKAIRLATGKYLMFIDGDDIIYSHGIAFFVQMMEQFPSAALAVQKNYYNNIIYPALVSSREIIVNYFFGKVSFLTSSLASNFFRTDILQRENGLSEQYKIGDDEIRLRLSCNYPVLLVAGWVTWPRETPGQASSKLQNGVGLSDLFRIVRNLSDSGLFKRLGAGLDELILKKVNGQMISEIKWHLRRGKWDAARSLMTLAGIKWKGLFEVSKPLTYPEDFLIHSTPARPYKNSLPFKSEE